MGQGCAERGKAGLSAPRQLHERVGVNRSALGLASSLGAASEHPAVVAVTALPA